MPFDPTFEPILDALAAQMTRDDEAKLKALAAPERENLHAHVQGVIATLSVGIVFLQGFEAIATRGELATKVSAEVKQWVTSVPRSQSGGRIAGMIAASTCSVLEDYLVDLVPQKLTPARLVTLRAADPKVPPDDAAALKKLTKQVKPSVRAQGTEWVAALNSTFSISLTPEEAETLIDLITFRNQYIHDPPTAFARVVTGEHIKCWTLATMILCNRLVLS